MTTQTDIYVHTRNGGMTEQEYDDLHEQLEAARKRGDTKEYKRLLHFVPLAAEVAKAFKEVYGRDYIISSGFDVTEAEMKFGKGWLDE